MAAFKNVLLIQAPPWGITTFPLGIAYVSAYLQAREVPVSVFDLNVEMYAAAGEKIKARWHTNEFEFWSSGAVLERPDFDTEEIAERILAFPADIIGFSTTFASIPFTNVLLEKIRAKRPECVIIIGGAGPSYAMHRSFYRKDLIDYFIIGEGEELFYQLVKRHSTDAGALHPELDDIFRCWKDEETDRVECLEARASLDLDALPWPTYEGFLPDLYSEKDLLPIIISRGCPNACHFCCDWRLKKTFRVRDPKQVLQEMQYLIERYDRRRFEFSDLLVNGDLKQLETLCDLIISAGLQISWGAQAAVRRDMKGPLLRKMRRAGCGSLTFGFESFSDSLLKKMNKRFTARDATSVIKRVKKSGMLVEANLLIGFPGETEADIVNTIKFLKQYSAFIDRINSLNICSVGPGMSIWEHSLQFNIFKDEIADWYAWHTADCSNTLAIREKRHQRLKEFIEQEGLGLGWENLRRVEH
jgi:anaerobic magnesium-protoporphyrin IX monomethyl ester cyclase